MADLELLALHGLAVKKAGSPADVAAILGRDEAEVTGALEAAVATGRAIAAKGTMMVTPAGRQWLEQSYPAAFDRLRADPSAGAAYERFERINRELLCIFTDWQSVPAAGERVPNDHADVDYDHRVIDRLGDQHERAQRPLEELTALEERMAQYQRRLDAAYDKVLAGEHEFVSAPRLDSYHTVWFELHEDLLRMLGREREEQP
jgi:hypothetical protein